MRTSRKQVKLSGFFVYTKLKTKMKSFIFLISCILFCMSDNLAALAAGVFLMLILLIIPNKKTNKHESNY